MRPSSRANRPGACWTAAVFLVASAVRAWGAALAPAVPPATEVQYQNCLEAARRAPDKALEAARQWRDSGGGFPAAHCVAVALFALRHYAAAAQHLEALAAAMMGSRLDLRAGALAEAGQAWLMAGEPANAITAYSAALAYTPDNPTIHIDRARVYGEEKQYVPAIADLDAALTLAPRDVAALTYRATAYRRLGKLNLALADADRALVLAPKDAAARLERGNIRRLQGDAAGARDDWRAVERLAANSPEARAAAANLAALTGAR